MCKWYRRYWIVKGLVGKMLLTALIEEASLDRLVLVGIDVLVEEAFKGSEFATEILDALQDRLSERLEKAEKFEMVRAAGKPSSPCFSKSSLSAPRGMTR